MVILSISLILQQSYLICEPYLSFLVVGNGEEFAIIHYLLLAGNVV